MIIVIREYPYTSICLGMMMKEMNKEKGGDEWQRGSWRENSGSKGQGHGEDDRSRREGKRVEGKDKGEGCNSLLSSSPAPSPNLPRTINQIRRQTLIEDYNATGSTTHTQTHTH